MHSKHVYVENSLKERVGSVGCGIKKLENERVKRKKRLYEQR